ncbi:metallophosphoesterase [Catenovulum sp. 2E275]|uniref:metallophosphoesterase family protein n=1 Tax=Catenovulum sp. 2E275 TaxID=2980497 RepID=UPI0021D27D7D|nr:metallophosphoesterase [Catenovulum sp. 2E275]MCU4675326.1 metallophosphoesterase [Catenovulum sp. 2E275]
MPLLKFAQITDCHIKANKTDEFYGCLPYQNLRTVLADIAAAQTEYNGIIWTGDLVQDEVWQSYQNILDAIGEVNWQIPFYAILGNHDKPALFERFRQSPYFSAQHLTQANLQNSLQAEPPQNKSVIEFEHWALLLFNSYADDLNGGGRINEQQLEQVLSQVNPKITHYLVVLHHHLVPFASFIDKYSLQQSDAFLTWFEQNAKVKAAIHGHVHTIASGTLANKAWFAGPASSVQFGHADKFEITDTRAAYQQISLLENGQVKVLAKTLVSSAEFLNDE